MREAKRATKARACIARVLTDIGIMTGSQPPSATGVNGSFESGAALIVFAGLSLSLRRAAEICDGDIRGPIQAGDLDQISPPAIVVIIDGVLEPGAAISLPEVSRGLTRGLHISGASSTGALLAVELHNEGMIGSGRVFEFLKAYGGDRADLVSVLFCAHDLAVVTQPLVNAALALVDAGLVDPVRGLAIDALKEIPLAERTMQRIAETLRRVGAWPITVRDHKAADAIALLSQL